MSESRLLRLLLVIESLTALVLLLAFDEVLASATLLPHLIGVWAARNRASWGALLLLAMAPISLIIGCSLIQETPVLAISGYLTPGLAAISIFALRVRGIWRQSRWGAAFGVLFALGLSVDAFHGLPNLELEDRYWSSLGARDAEADARQGRFKLYSFGRVGEACACGLSARDEALARKGITVECMSSTCGLLRRALRWFGYNKAIISWIKARRGQTYFDDLE